MKFSVNSNFNFWSCLQSKSCVIFCHYVLLLLIMNDLFLIFRRKMSWNLFWSQCVSLLEKLWPSVIYWPSTVKNIKSAFLWHLIQKQLFERFFQRVHNSLCDEKRGRLLQYRSPTSLLLSGILSLDFWGFFIPLYSHIKGFLVESVRFKRTVVVTRKWIFTPKFGFNIE